MEKVQYLNAFLDRDEQHVVAVYRHPETNKVIGRRFQAEWASFHNAADIDGEARSAIRKNRCVRKMVEEGPWLRIVWSSRVARQTAISGDDSPFVRRGILSYEGDVDPVTRWLVDESVEIAQPRRCYLDIESDSEVSFAEKERMRVYVWTIVPEEGDGYARGVLKEDTDASEKELLAGMWEALRDYDQVLAWNGDEFDFPVLLARSEKRSVKVDARRWLFLDHLALFRRMNMHSAESGDEKQSMRLEDIGQAVVGRGKAEAPEWVREEFGDRSLGALSHALWHAGGKFRQLLADYCLDDTRLLRDIERETGYAALFGTLCDACHLFADTRGLNPTRQMDGFLLRLGRERGHHFATKAFREESEQFEGAFVMDPRTVGIEHDVHVCDFSSLYPSIILSWNMSPDTKLPGHRKGWERKDGECWSPLTGICFSTKEPGILPTALRELLRLRKFWNDKKASLPPGTPEWVEADRRSTAYKVAANSFYGVVGSPYSRFFDREVAESVTQCGVWLIKRVIEEAERRNWIAVFGDTDSAFIKGCPKQEFEEFVAWCNKDLFPSLLSGVGCVENHIKLAYEKQFARLVIAAAKKYCGSYVHYKGKLANENSKPEIKGLEYKRGDATKLGRALQGEVIDMLVGGLKVSDKPVTDSVADYEDVLGRMLDRVMRDPLALSDVKLSKSLSKPLKEYGPKPGVDGGSTPAHARVAAVLKQRGEAVTVGTRIDYVVVDASISPMKVVPVSDYDGTNIDRHHVWENLVAKPTIRLLRAAFPSHPWERWESTRPRGKAARVLPGQLALLGDEEMSARPRLGSAPPRMLGMIQVAPRAGITREQAREVNAASAARILDELDLVLTFFRN